MGQFRGESRATSDNLSVEFKAGGDSSRVRGR